MNKLVKGIVVLVLVAAKISCTPSSVPSCSTEKMKTLFTVPGGTIEGDGYSHYILIENFSKKCMDSATMVDLALKYSDTVKVGRPVDFILFFNSDKDFIPHETAQLDEIYKSCLVKIFLSIKTKMPNEFIFCNEKGEDIYSGKSWSPNGGKDDKHMRCRK